MTARGSAKALALTILGEMVLPRGGKLWTSTLLSSLMCMGIEERNARQALARLADDGLISSFRQGRRALWVLTEKGSRLLSVGAQRIYGFGSKEDQWDGRWLVVLVSVPEHERPKRHRLKSQLEFAGFGFVAPGVAICPHVDREEQLNEILRDLALDASAIVLRAEPGLLVSEEELLRRAWDLDGLAKAYEAFLSEFEAWEPKDESSCFVALISLVHAWRRFPFEDPEIPSSLLPEHWPGHRAKALFDDRRSRWGPQATKWFSSQEGAAEGSLEETKLVEKSMTSS